MTHLDYPWMSFSALNTYLSCPRRFKYKYIDLFDTYEGVAMRRGTIMHDAYENFFNVLTPAKVVSILKNEDMTKPVQQTNTYKTFYATLRSVTELEDPIFEDKRQEKFALKCASSFSLLETKRLFMLHSEVPELDEVAIGEYWFPTELEATYADEQEMIYGKIDRVVTNPDGSIDLVDYKTGGGKQFKKKPSRYESLQARLYMHIFAAQQGISPKDLTFYFVYTNVSVGKLPLIFTIPYHGGANTRLLGKVGKIRSLIDRQMFDRCDQSRIKWGQKADAEPEVVAVTDSQKPFKYKKVCAHCDFTLQCHGIEREEFNTWTNSQFYEAME